MTPGLAHDLLVGGARMLLTIFAILVPIVTGLELLRHTGRCRTCAGRCCRCSARSDCARRAPIRSSPA
jgi:hypothetical protein